MTHIFFPNARQFFSRIHQQRDILSTPITIRELTISDIANKKGFSFKLMQDFIKSLFVIAEADHYLNADPENMNYITRISSSEFMFFAQIPLTMDEFGKLYSYIENCAKQYSSHIHLVLSSFSVTTQHTVLNKEGNQVHEIINCCLYVVCGAQPQMRCILKNTPSNCDINYRGHYHFPISKAYFYRLYDMQASRNILNQKDQQGLSRAFSRFHADVISNHMIFSTQNSFILETPGGIPFIQVVEICFDHWTRHGLININLLINNTDSKTFIPRQVSHLLTSNSIDIRYTSSVCDPESITQVDPQVCNHYRGENLLVSCAMDRHEKKEQGIVALISNIQTKFDNENKKMQLFAAVKIMFGDISLDTALPSCYLIDIASHPEKLEVFGYELKTLPHLAKLFSRRVEIHNNNVLHSRYQAAQLKPDEKGSFDNEQTTSLSMID